MRKYSEEEKLKYCQGFKKCTMPITEYAVKMKIPPEELKHWLKEYKEPPAFGAIKLSEVFKETTTNKVQPKFKISTETIKIEILENYERDSLMNMVKTEYKMNPYQKAAFLFCNRKRTSIKLLCYDRNGFILAQKTLLDVSKYKFKWPKNEKELGQITHEQLRWLLSGLQINPKTYFNDIDIENDKIAI